MTRRSFNVLVVSGDGTRVIRLTIPGWTIALGLLALVAAAAVQGLVWAHYASPRAARGAGHVAVASRSSASARDAAAGRRDVQHAVVEHRAGEREIGDRVPTPSPAPAASAPVTPGATDGQSRTSDGLQRRVDRIAAEIASWNSLHAGIWKTVGPDHQHQRTGARGRGVGGAAVAVPSGADGDPLGAQLDRLLAAVVEEGQQLRALSRLMARAGKVFAALPSRWPTRGPINSEFGRRPSPWTGEPELHQGIDIAAATGTPVTAPGPGTVAFAGRLSGYGNAVLLDHGHDVKSRFGHLDVIRVIHGQHVKRGEVIGLAGSTGRSTGPHLHYEVIVKGAPVNPRTYMWE
jgi:murein DD-endopeptidase MepM/ murein hydrolase activator NlpD